MNPAIDHGAVSTTDLLGDVEMASAVTMPRGIEQANRPTNQCFRVIDTLSLRSSPGSRAGSFDNDESMTEFVTSIASFGIIEPIVVRQMSTDAFIVVAGERRLAAAKLLNLRQVPCIVTQCSDAEALEISLTENLQRSELNPIEKACALRRLLIEFALTQQEIGHRVGMSQSAIAHHLRLLSLPQEVQRLISEGALSVGHGKVLAGIEDEQMAIDAALDCISSHKSVREFEASLSDTRAKADKPASREAVRASREERELLNGLFLVIKERRDSACIGTIEIPFYSLEDKNWVLRVLSEQGSRQGNPEGRARSLGEPQLLKTDGRLPPGKLRGGAQFATLVP